MQESLPGDSVVNGTCDGGKPIDDRAGSGENSAETWRRRGEEFLEQGSFEDARVAFGHAVESGSRSAATYYDLGRAQAGCGKAKEAAESYRQALFLKPDYHQALNNLGNILEGEGRLEEARDCFERAIRIDPNFTVAVNNLGLVHMKLGDLDGATALFRRALALQPNLPLTWNYLGRLLLLRNAPEEAVECFRRALACRSDYAEACLNLAVALAGCGKREEAVAACRKALSLRPDYPEAWNNLGIFLKEQGESEEAGACFERALETKPHFTNAMNNLGVVRFEQGRLDEAAALYHRALALKPDLPEALSNLGQVLRLQDRLEESLDCYRRALSLNPNFPDALINLGSSLSDAGLLKEAVLVMQRAVSLKSDCPDLHKNLGLALLAAGRLEEGWREFEWRWQCAELAPARPRFSQPRWRGESAEGRVLLLYAEQGLGDTIQFCRYAPLAAARGLRVVLAVQQPLVKLMQSLAGVEKVLSLDDRLPPFDFHLPLMSLPHLFGTRLETIPGDTPYLFPDKEAVSRWEKRICDTPSARLRVGLVWAGRARIYTPVHATVDRRRSMAPEMMAPILRVPGARFYSLQKDSPPVPGGSGLVDFMDECLDFEDTAALIANLDLVISVDTAVAHLAGSLGKPVWLLNRFDSCWRWLRECEGSPWYPTLRQFRQPSLGDWQGVIVRVRDELARCAGGD